MSLNFSPGISNFPPGMIVFLENSTVILLETKNPNLNHTWMKTLLKSPPSMFSRWFKAGLLLMLRATADMIKRYHRRGSQSGCGNSRWQSWKTSAHACGWLFLVRFRSFDQWKFSPLNNVVLAGDFLAITTFNKMELDEFWEQSNSTRRLWHTKHFMRWVVSCTKANFSEVLHPQNVSKNNFSLFKARLNSYLFTTDLVF